MHVHAAAGAIEIWLGHEAGGEAVPGRHRLDDAPEQDGVIARPQRVGIVMQVDLELARRILRDRGRGRHLLQLGRGRDVAHDVGIDVEAADAVELARRIRFAGGGRDRRQRLAQRAALAVHQVEFQLHRDHRREPALGEARQQPRQQLARIDQAGLVLLLRHGEQHLRGRLARPRHRRQRRRHRKGVAVGIAARFRAAAGVEVFAGHVEEVEAERQLHAAVPDLAGLMHRKALAARHAVHVGEEGVDLRHRGMGFQKARELATCLACLCRFACHFAPC